mgnify:CR=1 FL=1
MAKEKELQVQLITIAGEKVKIKFYRLLINWLYTNVILEKKIPSTHANLRAQEYALFYTS